MHEPPATAPRDDPGPRLVDPARLAGKYMTFELAGEAYGVAIMAVREFAGLVEIMPRPRAPAFVSGVIQLRGALVPVIDLRVTLGLPGEGVGDGAVVIVLRCRVAAREITMGVLADRVLEGVAFGADDIGPPPVLGDGAPGGDLLVGVGRLHRRAVFLLDAAALLSRAAADLHSAADDGAVPSL